MNKILVVAHKEFRDGFRNYWVLAAAGVYAILALAIAYFGAVTAGHVGFTSFDATIASLTTLAAFVIPLIGLLIAHDTIVGERDDGTLPLLLSYPVSRSDLVAGKFLGHSAVLTVATIAGFGAAVAAIGIATPEIRTPAAWSSIANFLVSASLLGASFVGIACLISTATSEKARAAGLAFLSWFFVVVVFDLVLLGVLVLTGGNAIERAIYPYLLLLNPIDVFRLINLTGLGGSGGNAFFIGMTAAHVYPPAVLYAALVAWIAAPLGVVAFIFRRQEI
ncbi:MAG: ABC transporter permease [Alphaproteobacteria bacterium]|nr:ABC transporter permease [Alphaproteobacteria bacterium]